MIIIIQKSLIVKWFFKCQYLIRIIQAFGVNLTFEGILTYCVVIEEQLDPVFVLCIHVSGLFWPFSFNAWMHLKKILFNQFWCVDDDRSNMGTSGSFHIFQQKKSDCSRLFPCSNHDFLNMFNFINYTKISCFFVFRYCHTHSLAHRGIT